MGVYNYLLNVEKHLSPFPPDVTHWDTVRMWMLHNLYGARYWRSVAVAQALEVQACRKAKATQLVERLTNG